MRLLLISLFLLTSCAETKVIEVRTTVTQFVPVPFTAPAIQQSYESSYDDYDWSEIDEEIDNEQALLTPYEVPRAGIELDTPFETKQQIFEGLE